MQFFLKNNIINKNFRYFGSLNIMNISVTGLKKAIDDNLAGEKNDYLHVKVHFDVNRIGLIQVVSAEAYFSQPNEDLTNG